MGFEYALVHIKYTIPPAIALTFFYRPLSTWVDVYKVLFLISIALISTIPWDSYLIRCRIWSYPPNAIIGPTLFGIPAEELFFFVIQTYNTSLLYLLLSKPTFHPAYLRAERKSNESSDGRIGKSRFWRWTGQVVLASAIALAGWAISSGGKGTYLGLIVGWATPFLLLLWSLSYQFWIGLPWTNTILPIALPTLYLWIVDTLALRRGTWVIETGTKLGVHLWPHLEIEEAFFFVVTNCLIVFGLVAFDNALAVLYAFSPFESLVPEWASPVLLVKALLMPASEYDEQRIVGLQEAVATLRSKSRSFFLASSAFQGKIRLYLIVLYSFCRVADDLVDEAPSVKEAKIWISKLRAYLDIRYDTGEKRGSLDLFVRSNFPSRAQSALLILPTGHLSHEPLEELLRGFEMDLAFAQTHNGIGYPIENEADLELYGSRVAGTVARLCLEILFAQLPSQFSNASRSRFIGAGGRMGIALQYVNIARDIAVDARLGRVYIPLTWLAGEGLTPEAVIKNPKGVRIENLRNRILDAAFAFYEQSRPAIEELPVQVRGPMRVAVESYMEIGRVLREETFPRKAGRATVPKIRRLLVAWKALSS